MIFGKLIRKLVIKGYLLKASIGYRIFGIDFVAQEISKVPLYIVPFLLTKYGAIIGKNVNFKSTFNLIMLMVTFQISLSGINAILEKVFFLICRIK